MSTTTCKIPLGVFYGHMVVLPGEDYSELSDSSSFNTSIFDPSLQVTINTQCNILSALAEDVQCRYCIIKMVYMMCVRKNDKQVRICTSQKPVTKIFFNL